MQFFVPGRTPEESLRVWQSLSADGKRAVHSVTYEHEGSRFVVTVGAQRQEYRRETGPRGGYIKNAGHEKWPTPTGSRVNMIIDEGTLLEVWSDLPTRGWANPSLVGKPTIESIDYFEPPEGAQS